MGDKLFYKSRTTFGNSLTIIAGNSFIRAPVIQLNSMAAIVTAFGQTPGLSQAAVSFNQYKLRGVKLKFTYWPLGPNTQPVCAYTNADAVSAQLVALIPTIDVIPEQRWGKYRTLTFPGQGAKPTSLSTYYSVNKVWGPDRTESNSVNFTSSTTLASPFHNVPVAGPFMEFGLFTMSGFAALAPIEVEYKVEVTSYLQYWGRRPSTQ